MIPELWGGTAINPSDQRPEMLNSLQFTRLTQWQNNSTNMCTGLVLRKKVIGAYTLKQVTVESVVLSWHCNKLSKNLLKFAYV